MNLLTEHPVYLKYFLPFLTFLSFVLLSLPTHAVDAIGEGTTYRQALNNALKQAVEQALGTQVENRTVVENFMVVREQILNHTKGYVRSYEVIEEQRLETGLHRLKIRADVDEAQLISSQDALLTLMKMSAHPKVYIIGLDDDFDAVSSLNPKYQILQDAVVQVVRDEFKLNVIDQESFRQSQKDRYRHTDRRNNMIRAQKAQAQFALFYSVIKSPRAHPEPLELHLEAVDVATGLSLAENRVGFNMESWTRDAENQSDLILKEAQSLIHAPAAQMAEAMIQTLQKEAYGEGKRYELQFSRFDEKTIKFLEDDLTRLSGYVRHQLQSQKKNALTLSYWSELRPGALNAQISDLLLAQDIPFNHSVKNRNLTYRFKDPFFE